MKTLNLYSKGFRPKNILNKKILLCAKIPPRGRFPRTLHPSRKPRFQGSAPPPHCSATPCGRPSTTAHEHSGREIFTQAVISLPASFLNLPTSFLRRLQSLRPQVSLTCYCLLLRKTQKKNCGLFPFSHFFCVNYVGAKNAKRI